jgi:alcohol dehydrogenase class IV
MPHGALFGSIAMLTASANLAHAMAHLIGNQYHTHYGETIAVLTPHEHARLQHRSDPDHYAEIAEFSASARPR